MMEKSNLKDYIDLIVSNEDVKKAKPDPEMYNYAISKFGFESSEYIVVEDNPNGIQAGKASGASVLEVATVYDVNYDNIYKKIMECNK